LGQRQIPNKKRKRRERGGKGAIWKSEPEAQKKVSLYQLKKIPRVLIVAAVTRGDRGPWKKEKRKPGSRKRDPNRSSVLRLIVQHLHDASYLLIGA